MKNQEQTQTVDCLQEQYIFLTNGYCSTIQFQGKQYKNVEEAFQQSKTKNKQLRQQISLYKNQSLPINIKQQIQLSFDWQDQKDLILQKLVRSKFNKNQVISKKLISTQNKKLQNIQVQLQKALYIVRKELTKFYKIIQQLKIKMNLKGIEIFPKVQVHAMREKKNIQRSTLNKQKKYLLIGTDQKCDLKLRHPSINKIHAAIYYSEDHVYLIDINSKYYTIITRENQFKNRKLIPWNNIELRNNDKIIFGSSSRVYTVSIGQ